jgi:hypothetical protein
MSEKMKEALDHVLLFHLMFDCEREEQIEKDLIEIGVHLPAGMTHGWTVSNKPFEGSNW